MCGFVTLLEWPAWIGKDRLSLDSHEVARILALSVHFRESSCRRKPNSVEYGKEMGLRCSSLSVSFTCTVVTVLCNNNEISFTYFSSKILLNLENELESFRCCTRLWNQIQSTMNNGVVFGWMFCYLISGFFVYIVLFI